MYNEFYCPSRTPCTNLSASLYRPWDEYSGDVQVREIRTRPESRVRKMRAIESLGKVVCECGRIGGFH